MEARKSKVTFFRPSHLLHEPVTRRISSLRTVFRTSFVLSILARDLEAIQNTFIDCNNQSDWSPQRLEGRQSLLPDLLSLISVVTWVVN